MVRPHRQVPVDDDPHWQTRPLGQSGLDSHFAPSHLLLGLIHAVLQAVTKSDDDAITILTDLRCRQLGAHAQ